jgi:hypothetical protein
MKSKTSRKMMQRRLITGLLVLVAALIANRAEAERIALFDGETLSGWVTEKGQPVTKGWQVVDGALTLDVSQGRAGHIVTEQEYDNFSLEFEWKIAKGGNSGLKYKVKKFGRRTLGCEYQIIDDADHRDGKNLKKSTGSLYDVYPPNEQKFVRPLDEFNHSRIVVCGNRIEHWLNGTLIVAAHVGSTQWHANIAESKFNDVAGFGENSLGKIMLTDHNSQVWYRNIYLTPLQLKSSVASETQRNGVRSRIARRRADRRR